MPGSPPREIQTLIDSHINRFNTQNIELFLGVFGDTAIIIDGIAPYRWLNPNAPANWLADVKKWREDLEVSYEHLSYLGRGRPAYSPPTASRRLARDRNT